MTDSNQNIVDLNTKAHNLVREKTIESHYENINQFASELFPSQFVAGIERAILDNDTDDQRFGSLVYGIGQFEEHETLIKSLVFFDRFDNVKFHDKITTVYSPKEDNNAETFGEIFMDFTPMSLVPPQIG